MRILITGATGLIGRSLSQSLMSEGHAVVGLSREPEKAGSLPAAEVLKWDPLTGPPPPEAFGGADAVVHLAGEPIAARRWSEEQKRRIRDSRVVSTRNLVSGLRSAAQRPAVLVSGSAVGYYGDRRDEPLDEGARPGSGFLSDVCKEWEAEADRAADLSVRVVKIRTGVVLSREGGALKKMLPAFKLGVAGRLGSGKQWFPWIHIEDIVGLIRHAVFSPAISGAVNGVAPEPVTNAEFTSQLARAVHRPAFLPVPELALRALMGEMASVLLDSQRVVAKSAQVAGYQFRYPTLACALDDLFGGRGN